METVRSPKLKILTPGPFQERFADKGLVGSLRFLPDPAARFSYVSSPPKRRPIEFILVYPRAYVTKSNKCLSGTVLTLFASLTFLFGHNSCLSTSRASERTWRQNLFQ